MDSCLQRTRKRLHAFVFSFSFPFDCSLVVLSSKAEVFGMAAVGRGYNELERRRVIKTLLDAGVEGTRELCERSGLCKATVVRVRNRLLAGGTIERKVGSGSLRHLSGVAIDSMHDIVQTVLQNGGSASTAKIRDHIEEETGEVVSRRTVCRALHREGLAAKRRRPGPALMDHHKEARQVWSLLHRDEAFDATVFIDEANFQLHRNTQVVWCPANEAPPRIGLPHTSPSITVLAGVSSVGTTPLVTRQGESWNAERFVESLGDDIEPITNAFFAGQHRYMLDNAPCHRAQLTRAWADANGVQLFFQPAYSPDLQPQENIWSLMKARVERRAPQNLAHLEQLLHEVWAELTIDDVAPFWESMSRRIESVIDAAGSWTSY